MPFGNYTRRFDFTSTATGSSTALTFDYADGMGNVSMQYSITGTTKAYSFTLQGSIGNSGIWTNLTAVTTGSTSGALANSTVAMTFDKVRTNFTVNDSTGNGTFTGWLNCRP